MNSCDEKISLKGACLVSQQGCQSQWLYLCQLLLQHLLVINQIHSMINTYYKPLSGVLANKPSN